MDSSYFGWELLYRLIEDDVRGHSDLLVAIIHWQLVRNEFICLGIGEEKIIKDTDEETEALPIGWNREEGSYFLRYLLHGELYILQCVIMDEKTALFNLLNVNKSQVSNVSFELPDIMSHSIELHQRRKIQELVPKIAIIVYRVRDELILPASKAPAQVPAASTTRYENPNRTPSAQGPVHQPLIRDPRSDFSGNIGRQDLDPFAQGGGMLGTLPDPFAVRPRHPHGMPGYVPGARFDPFTPLNPNPRRYGPDNDHFRAPGYDDDMFS